MMNAQRARRILGALIGITVSILTYFYGNTTRIRAGVIMIFVCVLSSVLTAFLRDYFRDRFGLVSLAWLVPILLILGIAFLTRFPVYVLVAMIVLSVGISESIYLRYVVDIKINDLGVAAPIAIVFLLYPVNLVVLNQNVLLQMYGTLLQSSLALVGLVFTLGIFILESSKIPQYELIKNMLTGFLSLFILLAILSLFGVLGSQGDLDISRQFLFSRDKFFSSSTLLAALLIETLCLFVSSLAYIFVMFSIFVERPKA